MTEITESGARIKHANTRSAEGGYVTDGTVTFYVKLNGRETTLTASFKNASDDADAHNQALQEMHRIASAFGQIKPRKPKAT
jgi:hypothetical protein